MGELGNNLKGKQHFYSDGSLWLLLIANIITIVWALKENWSLDLLIWVYFCQNIILGVFWPAKVFASSEDSSYIKKIESVGFFLPHYFIIHFVYGISLYNFFDKAALDNFMPIIILAGIFFVSEAFSYFFESSINRHISLAKVHFLPYARVVPMHFVMIIGIFIEMEEVNVRFGVIGFLILKALADIGMYMVERSSIFANVVTSFFESQQKGGVFDSYSSLREKQVIYRKEKQEVCRFCQRVINNKETPWVIRENVVCKECYDMIEKEKGKIS